MAKRLFAVACAITCVCTSACPETGCEEDPALSLLQSSARAVHSSSSASAKSANSETHPHIPAEVSYVNIMRHGEKCTASGEYLDPVGYARGEYLAKCLTSKKPSAIMPWGRGPNKEVLGYAVTKVLIGGGMAGDSLVDAAPSVRPLLTALPIIERLNITLDMPCRNHTNAQCIVDNLYPMLNASTTVIFLDTYQLMPYIVALLNVPASGGYDFSKYNHWPEHCPCNNPNFTEPHCVDDDDVPDLGWNSSFPYQPVSACFDTVWQIKFTLRSGYNKNGYERRWHAESIKSLAEGFAGDPHGPCAQDLSHDGGD